jgi:hypothetical protein
MPVPTDEAVAAAAQKLADAESAAKIAKDALRDLKPLFKDIHENGDAGLLLTRSMGMRADALGTQFEAEVWELHRQLTEFAKELGIDLPSIEGSGGR